MSLQDRAEQLIERLNFIDSLKKLGEVHLVGNVALGTTVKHDIDIQIYTKTNDWTANSDKITQILARMGLTEFIKRELKQSGKHLTSFAFDDETGDRWTLDITQTEPSEDFLKDAYYFLEVYGPKITAEKRLIILALKKHFLSKGLLHNSLSYYIYRAVLDEDIKTITEMYDYLKLNKIYINKEISK